MKTTTRTQTNSRFNKSLNRNHGVLLKRLEVNNRTLEIRTTIHSLERFEYRGVDIKKSLKSISRLGIYGLNRYAEEGIDLGIQDYNHNITTILTFESDSEDYIQIRVRTIIGRPNAYLTPGTKRIVLK